MGQILAAYRGAGLVFVLPKRRNSWWISIALSQVPRAANIVGQDGARIIESWSAAPSAMPHLAFLQCEPHRQTDQPQPQGAAFHPKGKHRFIINSISAKQRPRLI
jgi:hypothetical protein